MLCLYSDTITPRLQYIIGFFSRELFDDNIKLTSDRNFYQLEQGPRINYSDSDFAAGDFYIKPHTLLFEKGIRPQETPCIELNFQKAFFATSGDLPFDFFAASFYLLSRYEEYLPHEKDEYGRYAYTNSLAFKENFLQWPVINQWLEDFRRALSRKFPSLIFKSKHFKCLLTYDIDMAWSYRYKGWARNTGGLMKDLAHGQIRQGTERLRVLAGKQKDPFDCFEWLDALHLYCRIQPYYFFLVAGSQNQFDKNISTNVKAFQKLIEYYAGTYKIGLHPSWQSGNDPALLKEELEWLRAVSGKNIEISRQHYIRFNLPETFRQLVSAGIRQDFSMGYGSINGFRASVCSPFYWYDLEKETSTPLLLFPFPFMDANSFFEQKDTPGAAYAQLMQFYEQVKRYRGTLVTVWHNFILGTGKEYSGWRNMFELFMKETVYWDAYYDEV